MQSVTWLTNRAIKHASNQLGKPASNSVSNPSSNQSSQASLYQLTIKQPTNQSSLKLINHLLNPSVKHSQYEPSYPSIDHQVQETLGPFR